VAQLSTLGHIRAMTQKDKLWWEEMRSKGRGWFIFRVGIMRHGVRAGILLMVVLAIYAFFIFLFGGPHAKLSDVLGAVVAFVVTMLFVGGFVGIALWNQHERDYKHINITGDDHVA
jgi:Na+/proline symporter